MKAGIFLEQNGILNTTRIEKSHPVAPRSLKEFRVNQEAILPLRQLKAAGFVLIATANQPELSSGAICRSELDRMHELLRRSFALDDILICPHNESDHCPCRKPKPGLFTEAAFKWHLNLDRSFVISDKWQDAEAARTAGCTSFLIDSPWTGNGHHDFVLPDLDAVVRKIEQLRSAYQEV